MKQVQSRNVVKAMDAGFLCWTDATLTTDVRYKDLFMDRKVNGDKSCNANCMLGYKE